MHLGFATGNGSGQHGLRNKSSGIGLKKLTQIVRLVRPVYCIAAEVLWLTAHAAPPGSKPLSRHVCCGPLQTISCGLLPPCTLCRLSSPVLAGSFAAVALRNRSQKRRSFCVPHPDPGLAVLVGLVCFPEIRDCFLIVSAGRSYVWTAFSSEAKTHADVPPGLGLGTHRKTHGYPTVLRTT